MDFLVIITISAILSAGLFILIMQAVPPVGRLPDIRRFGVAFLSEAFASLTSGVKKYVPYLRSERRKELAGKEIYSALSILRNHASADSGDAASGVSGAYVTTDYILEQFALTEGVLKEAYAGALRLLRTGRRNDAAEYFTRIADVELARDFILLVLDWDAVPSHKLKNTVVAFQNALKETRTTELIRKNEVLSDLVYLPVITGVLIVFINFIYVAYFAEQRALLAELFF